MLCFLRYIALRSNCIFFTLYVIANLVYAMPLMAQYHESFDKFSQTMSVQLEDNTHTYQGNGVTFFINATRDTLEQLYFHAIFNAYQPNSEMHKRAGSIGPNRLRPEIYANLKPHEIGKLDMMSVIVNGKPARIERTGTIIKLDTFGSILPNDSVVILFEFAGQVPIQIRRNGRNNSQGVRYSMAQWYPKLCQYDQSGWHNNQFVAREFYGVWGKYDYKITLPAKYILGATGTLQNPQQVGHGYQFADTKGKTLPDSTRFSADSLLTWHFTAEPVHDVAWVADAQYIHEYETRNGITVHALYKPTFGKNWDKMTDWCHRTIAFYGNHYGDYPYKQFTSAMAGDGGMEYPHLIMLRSGSDIPSLLGVTVHELGHQWFYGIVANNETKHAWMDEGFTTYIENKCLREEFPKEMSVPTPWYREFFVPALPERRQEVGRFYGLAHLGYNQPMGFSHDRLAEERSAGLVYDAGAMLLHQLEYSFGAPMIDSLMKRYALTWRFRHPYPKDFEKMCETVLGQRLDDVMETFLMTTERPNYSILSLESQQTSQAASFKPIRQRARDQQNSWLTTITIDKEELAHIPLNLTLFGESGLSYSLHIPSDVRSVNVPDLAERNAVLPMWYWTSPTYQAQLAMPERIVKATLDTTFLMDDAFLWNNTYQSGIFSRRFEMGLWKRYDELKTSDVYGISVRPAIAFFTQSGMQVGLRLDGSADRERLQTTLGAYYNTRTNKVDWQIGYEDNFSLIGKLARIKAQAYSMDGADYVGVHITKDYRPYRYASTDAHLFSSSFEMFNITQAHPLLGRFRTISSPRSGINDAYSINSFSTPSAFMRGVAQYQYQSPTTQISLKGIFAAQERKSGLQSIFSLTHILTSNLLSTGTPLHLSLLSVLGSSNVPEQQQFSVNALPIADQINNTPARTLGFLASEWNVPMMIPYPTIMVGIQQGLRQSLQMATLSLGSASLGSYGLKLPFIDALRPGLYATGGITARAIQDSYERQYEVGASLKIKLSDVITWQQLLWMFPEETSLSVLYPIYSASSNESVPIIKQLTIGISMGLP